VATEAWQPNVDAAARRLRPLGVEVVPVEAAPDNAEQRAGDTRGRLPFAARSFHLVVARHEAFAAKEVARVLAAGGRFLTQQVGGSYDDFYRLLGLPVPPRPAEPWNLALARAQAEGARLQVVASEEAEEVTTFADVGAIAWYLRAVPWTVPGFSIHRDRSRLLDLHAGMRRGGPVSVRLPAFYLEAVKPPTGRAAGRRRT
jgi:SAM-dependent methyltransferase